jgi:hypothetical protein
MLHPALRQALATAHIEDLHRAATPRQTIRLQQRGLIHLQQGGLIRLQQRGLKPRESQAGVRRK